MKIEIWSDVMCPFCYIGKKHFERALAGLPFTLELEIVWKSYQLNPDYKNTHQEDLSTYLSRHKGMSEEQVLQMIAQVQQMAKDTGISMDLRKNVPANAFDAHRIMHLAQSQGLSDLAHEKFFEAHFIKHLDVDLPQDLKLIAAEIGLDTTKVEQLLASDEFADAVRLDVYEAQNLGIRSVPAFVLDQKYLVSGAQPVEAFVEAITGAYTEWKAAQKSSPLKPIAKTTGQAPSCEGDTCSI